MSVITSAKSFYFTADLRSMCELLAIVDIVICKWYIEFIRS